MSLPITMRSTQVIFSFILLLTTAYATAVSASVSSGTVTPGFATALVCHDPTCTTPTPGSINFRPTGTTPVTIDDTNGVDGIAWGTELGWITFNPTGSSGITINATTGALSGSAWSQVSGWVNFRPTGQGVSINSAGEFVGWAWTGGPNGGWIKFDCAQSACVKTDWRPTSARPVVATTGGGGGGGGIISGPLAVGTIVPEGTTPVPNNPFTPGDSSGDVCGNLPGVQGSIPSGYVSDFGGFCLFRYDFCPNMTGEQLSIPSGYELTEADTCVLSKNRVTPRKTATPPAKPAVDYCANFTGLQEEVPLNYIVDSSGFCVPEKIDYCPNLEGSQSSIPSGYAIASNGDCSVLPVPEVPQVLDPESNTNNPSTGPSGGSGGSSVDATVDAQRIIALPFMPKSILLPADIPVIGNMFRTQNAQGGVERPAVDVVSLGVTAAAIPLAPLTLFWLLLARGARGMVYNSVTKEALANTRLIFYSAAGAPIKDILTNAKGHFNLRLPKGDYSVKAFLPQHAFPSIKAPGTNLLAKSKDYRGGTFSVKGRGKQILEIPLDPMAS
jgi:hypothetical protein